MSGTFRPHGVWTALATPFSADGEVDYDSLRRLIEFQVNEGVDGVLPCGTTGESPTLSWQEHDAVVDAAVRAVEGRVGVLAGAAAGIAMAVAVALMIASPLQRVVRKEPFGLSQELSRF